MSDRAPKVVVKRGLLGIEDERLYAECREPGCGWTQPPQPSKTYVEYLARQHRALHRRKAATG